MSEVAWKAVLGVAVGALSIFSGSMAYMKWGVKATKETQTAKDEVQNEKLIAHKEVVELKFKHAGLETTRNSDDIQKIFDLIRKSAENVNEMIKMGQVREEKHDELVGLLTEQNDLLREENQIHKSTSADKTKIFKGALKQIAESHSLINDIQIKEDIDKSVQEAFGEDMADLKENMDIIMERSDKLQQKLCNNPPDQNVA